MKIICHVPNPSTCPRPRSPRPAYAQVDEAFVAYTGGIHSANRTGAVNHAVLVVGYGIDNATGTPYWVLRNSWGPYRGEDGYMHTKLGVNQNGIVDFRLSYPTIAGAPPPPDPPTPVPPDPPTPAPDSDCPPVYTVMSNDTLFAIAGTQCEPAAAWAARETCAHVSVDIVGGAGRRASAVVGMSGCKLARGRHHSCRPHPNPPPCLPSRSAFCLCWPPTPTSPTLI